GCGLSDPFSLPDGRAVYMPGRGLPGRVARRRLFSSRRFGQRRQRGHSRFLDELSHPSFSRAWRRRSHIAVGRRLDAKRHFHDHWALFALFARDQPRSTALSTGRRAAYSHPMNPLPNDWAIKHRADVCAATQRPFEPGEYFYALLFRDAEGFRREDLSEEAWQKRNENIQPFSFWRTRYEPLPEESEPLAKENAEQLFRRLIASENPPANACYVLAAMLERKRVLKQIKTESAEKGRLLIYEHGATGDVFIVTDPGLRLDELESVQNEVAQLLKSAA